MNVLTNVYIFGARATAAGVYKSLSKLEGNKQIKAFIVTDSADNPLNIWGVPVWSLHEISELLSAEEKSAAEVYPKSVKLKC